jgi:small subunit ribosomal protein S13
MRISGITVPEDKQLWVGLTVFYGIGFTTAKKILKNAEVEMVAKPADLSESQEALIRKQVESMTLEGDLKREKAANIKRLKDIKCYRGVRHIKGLPVHGQRTKTNARTLRGAKKTMGSGRRKVDKK